MVTHNAGVSDRPYVLLSCAMSVDGYIDDATSERLRLSNPADLDRVDAVRAGCDAILVGAGTIRADNPKLLIRSEARRKQRAARGKPADLTKVGAGTLNLLSANTYTGNTVVHAGSLVLVAAGTAMNSGCVSRRVTE